MQHTLLLLLLFLLNYEVVSDEWGVDTYELVDCPNAADLLDLRIQRRIDSTERMTADVGRTSAHPWTANESVHVGGFVGVFANAATRKKVVLTHGNTTYPGTTPMSGEGPHSIVTVQSVTKMLVGAVFLNRFRHLLGTPVIDTCGLDCGIPQAYLDAFFSGENANRTYYELFNMTSGLPDFVTDMGPGDTYDGVTMQPFFARMLRNDLGDRMYMPPEDVLNFSAAYFADYPQTRGAYHYANDNWYIISMAVEYLTGRRLSDLILELFERYVPCTRNTVCGLRFQADVPAWQITTPGPRTPVNLRPDVSPTEVYYEFNAQWVSGTNPAGRIAGDAMLAGLYPQIVQTQWGPGGAACSVSSLANFMIALSEGMIPNASVADFVYSGDEYGLFGHSGGGGAGGWFDPASGIVTAGTCNTDPQNGGIAEFYIEARDALTACLSGNSTRASSTAPNCTLTPTTEAPQSSDASDDDATYIYAGIALGGLFGIALGGFLAVMLCRARK